MTQSYLLGLSFIFLVVMIWSLASVLVQQVYRNFDFDSPFLLTYICTSLFVVLLPNRLLWESFNKYNNKVQRIPWESGEVESYYDNILASTNTSRDEAKKIMEMISSELYVIGEESETDLQSSVASIHERGDLENIERNAWVKEDFILGHYETFFISLLLSPFWFFANYFYNLSLQLTTVTSSTIIASTSSLFTFVFAVSTKDEKFTKFKFLGVFLCVLGSIITGLNDNNSSETENELDAVEMVWGDAIALLSALGYGVYTVLIRLKCPKDESLISMQLLFGYIGLINMIVLSPLVLYQYCVFQAHKMRGPTDTEQFITWTVFGLLVVKGLFDNVLSDYLWARSIVLTSATVATVGLGLTIPFAFLSDWALNGINPTFVSTLGALLVCAGFVLVNIEVN